jgi:hypothetical protein
MRSNVKERGSKWIRIIIVIIVNIINGIMIIVRDGNAKLMIEKFIRVL